MAAQADERGDKQWCSLLASLGVTNAGYFWEHGTGGTGVFGTGVNFMVLSTTAMCNRRALWEDGSKLWSKSTQILRINRCFNSTLTGSRRNHTAMRDRLGAP